MALKVVQVATDGPQIDVFVQGDSISELSDDHAPEWRKLAQEAVADRVASPMLRSAEYFYTDADGVPLGTISDPAALRSAKVYRKVSYVSGPGGRG